MTCDISSQNRAKSTITNFVIAGVGHAVEYAP